MSDKRPSAPIRIVSSNPATSKAYLDKAYEVGWAGIIKVATGHGRISDYERMRLDSYTDNQPLMVRPDKRGRISVLQRVRAVSTESVRRFAERVAEFLISLRDLLAGHMPFGHRRHHVPQLAEPAFVHDSQIRLGRLEDFAAGHLHEVRAVREHCLPPSP